ncbi:hypothetical protein ACQ86N_21135 [Puia sp. P3]|uniref:hypothetical protein n=1 Tax=Puia sp. P3 TaxID=3423952 RepID=UPI003D67B898
MKTGIYSVLFSLISNIAIGLCFVPFLLLGWKRIRQVSTFWILGMYWLLSGLVNLPMLQRHGGYHGLISILSRLYMMAETPLVLLAFASASPRRLEEAAVAGNAAVYSGGEFADRLEGLWSSQQRADNGGGAAADPFV